MTITRRSFLKGLAAATILAPLAARLELPARHIFPSAAVPPLRWHSVRTDWRGIKSDMHNVERPDIILKNEPPWPSIMVEHANGHEWPTYHLFPIDPADASPAIRRAIDRAASLPGHKYVTFPAARLVISEPIVVRGKQLTVDFSGSYVRMIGSLPPPSMRIPRRGMLDS